MTKAPNYTMLACEALEAQQHGSARIRLLCRFGLRTRLERANQRAIEYLSTRSRTKQVAQRARKEFVGALPVWVIGLVAKIAWDLFWHWWINRDVREMGS